MMKNLFERIMLIDDDDATNLYHQIILNDMEITNDIVVFQNGYKALEYLQAGHAVDLILLDINMPIINGWQFLELFQNLESEIKDVTSVIILTASANTDDKKLAASFSCVKNFIVKPIDIDLMNEIFK